MLLSACAIFSEFSIISWSPTDKETRGGESVGKGEGEGGRRWRGDKKNTHFMDYTHTHIHTHINMHINMQSYVERASLFN